MEATSSTIYLFLTLILSLPSMFLNTKISMASNILTAGQSLSGNQSLVSEDGTFAFGFFTPGNSHKFYVGIWYNKLPGQTIVWVANREAPIPDLTNSKVLISEHGELVLNSSGTVVWSSNHHPTATIAVLLDTGNLVLRSDSNSDINIWQSFAHPTDTWMPGGWLGMDKITGEYQSLTSWKSPEDPAPGPFQCSMNHDGSNEYVMLWNGTNIYWRSGLWNGQYFANVPGTRESTVFDFKFIDGKESKFASYNVNVKFILTRFVVDAEGQAMQWYWLNSTQEWQTEYTQPLSHCDVYSLCGPFGICDEKHSDSICTCADNFEPASEKEWENTDWSSGCSRKTQLKCEEDGFLEMYNMRPPSNPETLNETEVNCRESCLKICSCSAYVYDSSGCSIWKGKLRNLQQLYDGDDVGLTLFLRIAASDLPGSSSSSKTRIVAVSIGAVAGVFALIVIAFSIVCVYRRRKRARAANKIEGSSLVQFSYSDLQRITKNFSDKIGSGGFGSVFKGKLLNSTPVAVKKLEGAAQGDKQFRTEVTTLGAIQHVNLVRLYGFCSEGNKKLLVYELLPRSSLDSHLFRRGSTELDWKRRFQIVLGTARGLAYLHEECQKCIVHCDVKPDNVLLDEEYVPKVADFGMAKLIGRDFSKVLTTMRGTVGYLAPEWLAGLPITPKVDVYSFGMMVFEVVSGKRNTMHSDDGSMAFYPSWAARRIVEGEVTSLLDRRLEGNVDPEELTRVCRVACWCIQDLEDARPEMGQVVRILEGTLQVNMPPVPAALENLASGGLGFILGKSLIEEEKERSKRRAGIVNVNNEVEVHVGGSSYTSSSRGQNSLAIA